MYGTLGVIHVWYIRCDRDAAAGQPPGQTSHPAARGPPLNSITPDITPDVPYMNHTCIYIYIYIYNIYMVYGIWYMVYILYILGSIRLHRDQ